VTRLVDRGAITAAYVGVGMAVTIVASFTLIIPIEGLIWLLALPSGLLIGYYANQRSNRRAGPWRRIIVNGVFAGLTTGLAMVALLLVVKALFFYADNGYRDPGLGGTISCATGADCVYQRYLDAGHESALVAAGVSDASSFTGFYWREQLGSAGLIVALTVVGGLGGASLYGVFRPKPSAADSVATAR
jgi:hypothetical protein